MSGILAYYEWTPEQRAEADQQIERQRQRELAAIEWGAQLKRRAAEIDLLAGKYMAPQLERHKPSIKPADKQRFRDLQEFCRQNDWPDRLPISAHALYEHLVSENRKGYKHLLTIVRSIARCHELAGEHNCPTRDQLVKAYLDLIREDETEASTQDDQNV